VRLLHDAHVSRRHCTLEHHLTGVSVVHLGARPTCLDGRVMDGEQEAVVSSSAELVVGGSLLRIECAAAEPLPAIPGVRLVGTLGEGGGGIVYEGILPDGVRVAVKLLAAHADATLRRRLEREAKLGQRLDHPHIARILGLRHAEGDGRPALVRELVPGQSLDIRLAEGGPLPWRDAVRLGATVAHALAHAHQHGVLHRDVKPGNVVVDPDLAPKLIDFDLAKPDSATLQAELTRLTRTGEGLGSLLYLAPEQLMGARDVEASADVYGLGMTLYHALGGRPPFQDVEPEAFLFALTSRGPRSLRELAPRLPSTVVDVVERACARRAADRYAAAEELALALERLR